MNLELMPGQDLGDTASLQLVVAIRLQPVGVVR